MIPEPSLMLLTLITPTLGVFRNYGKYKQFDIGLFIRTPIIYCLLYFGHHISTGGEASLMDNNNIFVYMIVERWLLLLYKGVLSWINNDYEKKKEKYKIKYKLKYND